MCALAKVEKILAKGIRRGQDKCSYAFRRLLRVGWPVSTIHMAAS
jgi:hypothetical protein